LSCSACHVSTCPVLIVLSWLPCHGSLVLPVPFRLSFVFLLPVCLSCPPVLFRLSCLPILLYLSCFACLVFLSCFDCTVLPVLFCLSILLCVSCSARHVPACPVLAFMSWLSCPGCPVLVLLSR
jgi:hypothetical protein